MPRKPTTELVTIAWLKTIDGLPTGQIGTTLPADPASFQAGFVQVLTVGGSTNKYVPMRNPVVSLDFWAATSSGNKPPWGHANGLAETVYAACFDGEPVEVTITVGDYGPARVLSVYPVTEPRRILNDPGGFAHYSMDLGIHWYAIEGV